MIRFNEAGARTPQKGGKVFVLSTHNGASMRLGRERPRKTVIVGTVQVGWRSFNEAGARTPQKVVHGFSQYEYVLALQ